MSGAVVITGASTGIGRATALELDRRGFRVFAGVRKPEDGERLRAEATGTLEPLELEVTDADSIARAAAHVDEVVGGAGLVGLFNNAGVNVSGPLEFLVLDDLRWQLEVNLIGQIAVTQAFMPALRRGKGRIVFTGSMGGRIALPFDAPYVASKHALEAVADSLRNELRPFGMHVSLLEPGSIVTEIWRKGDEGFEDDIAKLPPHGQELYGDTLREFLGAAMETGHRGIPPQKVADKVVHALTARRPRTRYPVGIDARMGMAARKWLPDRLMDRMLLMQLRTLARKGAGKRAPETTV